eukprot:1155347-Pyramimonas_sp.AAC.1
MSGRCALRRAERKGPGCRSGAKPDLPHLALSASSFLHPAVERRFAERRLNVGLRSRPRSESIG